MTTVVGILNKGGVAIAADSAVTRNNNGTEKYTKNGNKMIRLCESSPISVMLTGNSDFLGNPWEVIARRYRSERGKVKHTTVKEAADDFFEYLAQNKYFWDEEKANEYLDRAINELFNTLLEEYVSGMANERKENGTLLFPSAFVKEFKQGCKHIIKVYKSNGRSPHFTDQRFEAFKRKSVPRFDIALFERSHENSRIPVCETFPIEILKDLRPFIEESAFMMAGHLINTIFDAVLVFTGYGYGPDQKYPSLVAARVNEGFDGMVNYHIEKDDVVEISDRRPVAICPFAQTEVISALLCGADHESFYVGHGHLRKSWKYRVDENFFKLINPSCNHLGLPSSVCGKIKKTGLYHDTRKDLLVDTDRFLRSNRRKWEKKLEKYDLRSMAELAECLVDMTGFQRILTFQQEGVGGAVDLAVISKTDGFCWLRRKDWYPRYSSNQYGNFGI